MIAIKKNWTEKGKRFNPAESNPHSYGDILLKGVSFIKFKFPGTMRRIKPTIIIKHVKIKFHRIKIEKLI